jgi:hypothetical protein
MAGLEDTSGGRWTVYLDAQSKAIKVRPNNIMVLPPPHRPAPHLECPICLEADGYEASWVLEDDFKLEGGYRNSCRCWGQC